MTNHIESIFAAAIDAAAPAELLPLYQRISQVWGEGRLADTEAADLLARIDARRTAPAWKRSAKPMPKRWLGGTSVFSTGRERPKSPDRLASEARRRRMAMAGLVPGDMAADGRVTMARAAVLAVIAEAFIAGGRCAMTIAAIAAKAGVCHRTAQNALRQAQSAGWIRIDERRRKGAPSLTNILRIASARWQRWLARRKSGRTASPAAIAGEGASLCTRPITQINIGPKGAAMDEGKPLCLKAPCPAIPLPATSIFAHSAIYRMPVTV